MPARMKVAIIRLNSTSSTRLIELSPGMIRSRMFGFAGPTGVTPRRLRIPVSPVISSVTPRSASLTVVMPAAALRRASVRIGTMPSSSAWSRTSS